MVFTNTTPWKPRNVKFFSKSSKLTKLNSVCTSSFVCREKNLPGFVNISPTLVIDMPTERSSRVLQHGNQKIWFFFLKFEIEFDLYFHLCWRAEINIQVGLNMHRYVDIGDASSSLWGSTSSPRVAGCLGNPRVTGCLGNPRVAGCLGNPRAAGCLGNPRVAGCLGNPRVTGCLGNPRVTGCLGNPRVAGCLGNPRAAKCLGNPRAAKCLGNPRAAKCLGNPRVAGFRIQCSLWGQRF